MITEDSYRPAFTAWYVNHFGNSNFSEHPQAELVYCKAMRSAESALHEVSMTFPEFMDFFDKKIAALERAERH